MITDSSNKRFSTFLLALVIFTSITGWLVWQKEHSVEQHNSWLLQHKRNCEFLDRTKSPRLILMGGSNTAFNYDTNELEHATGRHVVNIGVVFGMGLPFVFKQLAPRLRAGDVVIVVPVYHHYFGFLYGDYNLINYLFLDRASLKDIDSLQQSLALARAVRPLIRQRYYADLRSKLSESFSDLVKECLGGKGNGPAALASTAETTPQSAYRMTVTDSGEFKVEYTKKIPECSPKTLQLEIGDHFQAKEVTAAFQEFNATAKSKGALVLFAFTPIPEVAFKKDYSRVEEAYNLVNSQRELKLIGTPDDFVYPNAYFLDSSYHLRPEYKMLNTKRLEQLLPPDVFITPQAEAAKNK